MLRAFVVRCLAVAAVFAPAGVFAQKPVPSLSGAWTLSVQGGDHVIPFGLTVDEKAGTLSGVLSVMGNDITMTGASAPSGFTLTGTGPLPAAPGSSHGAAAPAGEFTLKGEWAADGTLTGTLSIKSSARAGDMKFTGERLKQRPVVDGAANAITSVAGDWTVNIVEAGLVAPMTLTQSGTAVTGTMNSDHLGTLKIAGTFVNGTFVFTGDGEAHGQTIHIEFVAKPQSATTLAGDLTSAAGAMTFTAERVKK